MATTLKRTRRAVVLGIAWAVAWAPLALAVGVLIIDPDNSMDEMWPVVGAYPGFLCGALFAGLLAMAERRRAFNDLALLHVAGIGALTGAIVGTVPFLIGTPGPGVPVATLAAWFISIVTVLSAASAVLSVLVMRRSKLRALRASTAMLA